MKKLLLSLSATALLSYQASAQTTISIAGTSGSINPTIGSTFGSTITLTISGTPPANVESVNLLLETPSTGANSGVELLYGFGDQRERLLLYTKQSGFSQRYV